MADAFRRFGRIQQRGQTNNLKGVIFLCVTFGAYGTAMIFEIPTVFSSNKSYYDFNLVLF
jgi:hypothetical protein